MLRGTFSIGRVAGTEVRIHWSAFAIAGFVGFALVRDLGLVVGLIGVASFFASILLHELSHAAVARRFGIATTSIDLWGLGGMARLDKDPPTPKSDGWIAVAGPAINAVVGGLAALGAWLLDRWGSGTDVVVSFAWLGAVNLALAAFNILPGSPLDGGRVFRAIRWARHRDRYRALHEAAVLGTILGAGLLSLGLSLMLTGRSGIWLLVSGLFVTVSARVEAATATLGERLGPVKVNEFTWFGVAEVGTDMDVDSMLWQRTRLGGAGAVVVRGDDGRLAGLVLEDQLWAVPSERRSWTMLTKLMAPFDRLARADVDDDLASVLPSVNPLRPVITVWRSGRLMGVIPPQVLRVRIAGLLAPCR